MMQRSGALFVGYCDPQVAQTARTLLIQVFGTAQSVGFAVSVRPQTAATNDIQLSLEILLTAVDP